MPPESSFALIALIFFVAALYSTVGHAGASGYLAAMALVGVSAAVMKPIALALNILVAVIASIKFARAGYFEWRIFWPFAIASIPLSFIGGAITLPTAVYKQLVGVILIYSAARLFVTAKQTPDEALPSFPKSSAMAAGAIIGFLSGLVGVGGGIFLSPLLLFARWATPRTASAVAAVFILVNSVAGLAGQVLHTDTSVVAAALAQAIPAALAAAAGGVLGSHWGSTKLAGSAIRQLLAVVLVIAGLKMIWGN